MPRVGLSLQWILPLQGANVGSLVCNENPGCRCACPGLCGAIGLSARHHICANQCEELFESSTDAHRFAMRGVVDFTHTEFDSTQFV